MLFALCSFFFFRIGWSPQYELFLVPLILLAFDDPLVGAVAALAAAGGDVPGLSAAAALGVLLRRRRGVAGVGCGARALPVAGLAVRLGAALRNGARQPALARAAFRQVADRAAPSSSTILASSGFAAPSAQAQHAAAVARRVCSGPRAVNPRGPDADALDWPVADGWFFRKPVGYAACGYSIVDDENAQMCSEFTRLGGWQVLGYPTSQRFMWHGSLSQATQRAVLQWSPITGQVEFANVLDLLHDAGSDDAVAAE